MSRIFIDIAEQNLVMYQIVCCLICDMLVQIRLIFVLCKLKLSKAISLFLIFLFYFRRQFSGACLKLAKPHQNG